MNWALTSQLISQLSSKIRPVNTRQISEKSLLKPNKEHIYMHREHIFIFYRN